MQDDVPFLAPPKLARAIPDQSAKLGEAVKFKVYYIGKAPLKFNLRKGSQIIPESETVKLTEFDEYLVVHLKGE